MGESSQILGHAVAAPKGSTQQFRIGKVDFTGGVACRKEKEKRRGFTLLICKVSIVQEYGTRL